MPSYRERVFICPNQSGQPGWILGFPLWWDRRGFFEKYGERRVDTGNPFYVDYGLLLSGWEAVAWDEQSRIQFASDARSNEPFFIETMQHWGALLKTTSWVIIKSYEWESGLS